MPPQSVLGQHCCATLAGMPKPGDYRDSLLYYNEFANVRSREETSRNAKKSSITHPPLPAPCSVEHAAAAAAAVAGKSSSGSGSGGLGRAAFTVVVFATIAASCVQCSESPDRDCCEPLYPFISITTSSSLITTSNIQNTHSTVATGKDRSIDR